MVVKKILTVIITMVMLCIMSINSVFASSSESTIKDIKIGRVLANMPEVTFEIRGKSVKSEDVENVWLGQTKLEQVEVKDRDDATTECAYVLVDVSGSIAEHYDFDQIKKYVKHISECFTKSNDDKFVLITFGQNEVKTLLDGDETAEEISNVIDDLKLDNGGTSLYKALNEVYNMSNSQTNFNYEREYAVVITDGSPDQYGDGVDKADDYESHLLPLYTLVPGETIVNQDDYDRLVDLSNDSGGFAKQITSMDEMQSFMEEINNVTIAKYKSDNNLTPSSKQKFLVTINEKNSEDIFVPITHSIPDMIKPEVKSFTYDNKNNLFRVDFTENINGSNSKGSYLIKDSDGKQWVIDSVRSPNNQGIYAELLMKNQIVNGEYTIYFEELTDCSKEKNPLTDTETIKVEGVVLEENIDSSILIIIILVVIMLLVVVSIIIIIVTKNKKSNEYDGSNNIPLIKSDGVDEINEYSSSSKNKIKHHIMADDGLKVSIRIKTGRSSEQNIETNVVSSLIFGRSSACDIFIDDTKLSRQHFVIENKNNELYVTDLQSKNGTFLNGIRIKNRRKIVRGDKILAGLSEIFINYM